MDRGIQAERLAALGASPSEIEELLVYNENRFDVEALGPETEIPPSDEPFVSLWEGWVEEARERGAFAVLAGHLPQLRFPIQEGISETEAYRAATRKGGSPDELPEATGLVIERPERIELVLYTSPAGRIPLIIARDRQAFVALNRALGKRNEPVPLQESQGALMISGYNNWERIHALRRRWESLDPAERETATWNEEMARILPRRELYQDRFILLSDGPYSAVPATELGLEATEWREASLTIRRDHECAHYFTRRLLGSMRNNLLDELIADYAGMTAATGCFRAEWFLRFLGLFPEYGPGARVDVYRGDPPLSDGAFRVLHGLIACAAESVERFDAKLKGPLDVREKALRIATLASFRLEDLAEPGAENLLGRRLEELRGPDQRSI
ncbi:MAG TPA: hypothetical protein VEL74_07685 [Thermoanaerobaculia bacterium]|nr:hypothetical protein [Thermoanaerobaculia bacterium]